MSENKEVNPALITLLLAGLTGLLAYVSHRSSLISERPGQESSSFPSVGGDQNQPARLWQDPLSVIKENVTNYTSPSRMRKQIGRWQDAEYKVSLLGIFVQGSPYPEDLEVRLRLRYAAQTALLESQFIPADGNHLGILSLPWPGRDYQIRPQEAVPPLEDFLPDKPEFSRWDRLEISFEWFVRQRTATETEAVLVLWLPEDKFTDNTVTRLLLVEEMLASEGRSLPPFNLLGPRSSTTLKSLISDHQDPARQLGHHSTAQLLAKLTLCSPEATAPDLFLADRVPENAPARESLKAELGKNTGITNFINLIATDDQLAANLVAELKLRGVIIDTNHLDQIALISEADTLYGRSLPLCFAAAVETFTNPGHTNLTTNLKNLIQGGNWPDTNLMRFSYLRGLDGTVARSDQAKKPKAESADGRSASQIRNEPNRAEGDAQFDYARRLAEKIHEATESESHHTHESLRAVGVLGSDIYDKLILLQALRDAFPEAWFFTTDLDARYVNSDLYPFTRNLIVSSAYGLQEASAKDSVMPFRDGYQTALYVGCKYFLSGSGTAPAIPKPRVYEIGRTRAVSFPAPASLKKAEDILLSVALPFTILLLLVCYAGAARFQKWFPSFPLLRNQPQVPMNEVEKEVSQIAKRKFIWQLAAGITGAVALVGLCVASFVVSSSEDGEPLYFSEGVSIWPTEFVRLFACFLAVSFVIRSWHSHQRHRVLMWRDYFRDETLREFQDRLDIERVTTRRRWLRIGYSGMSGSQTAGKTSPSVLQKLRALFTRRSEISISLWEHDASPDAAPPDLGSPAGPVETGTTQTWRDRPPVDAHRLFGGYASRGLLVHRLIRATPLAVLYIVLCAVVIYHFGIPSVPGRGFWSRSLDRIVLLSATFSFCFLAFYVIDAVRLTQRFVLRLSLSNTIWPPAILASVAERRKMDPAHLDGYLDVMFTARQTREVSALAFYPFTILFLLFISRNQFFDHWTWPTGLAAIFFLNALIIFVPAFAIRRTARKVREAAVRNLQHLQARFVDGHHEWPAPEDPSKVPLSKNDIQWIQSDSYGDALKLTLDEIQAVDTGAYAGILQDSTVIAALIPSGGVGLVTLLEKLFVPG